MTHRERIRNLIAGRPVDRCGLWLGQPLPESWPALHAYFKTRTEEELRQKLGDDFRWICPQFFPGAYRDPSGRGMFDAGLNKKQHGQAGPLAGCEDVRELDAFPWPDPAFLTFDACLASLRQAGDVYRASGFWTCFYHRTSWSTARPPT